AGAGVGMHRRRLDDALECGGDIDRLRRRIMRPSTLYRREFRRLVLAEQPRSLLEVGSGNGELLREMLAAGVRAEGIEADAQKVAAMRDQQLPVQVGRAEDLPYADGAFDVVVSEYCAHHFADLARHLAEAARVASKAVLVLDPWYDESIDTQRTAAAFDRWFKAIDRAGGMVHHDVLDAEHFRAAMPANAGLSFECRHLLQLVPVDFGFFDAESAPYLDRATATEKAELAAIRATMAARGMTDDGAILVLLRRPPG
ncbi:MAG TPA: class I SAM-dependent methyltransferase, partial [Planctomycetota bacterium]|nr:class I SAM-dependent methyltransferase [Planctomycetota bacterium]